MSCPYGQSDAAYVLGALSPAERSDYEAHLPECGQCAAAVARLAPMPGLLGRVDPATLAPAPNGPSRLSRLLTAVTEQRHRRARVRRLRLAAAVAAAAVLAVAGSAVWFGPLAQPSPAPSSAEAMQRVATDVSVSAEVALAPAAGGTEVWMACQYPAADYTRTSTFRLVAIGADGSIEQVGSWTAGPGEEVTLTGRTWFVTDNLARIELRDDSGATLLTYELR